MSISKKIMTAAFALIASICLAIAFFVVPSYSPSAKVVEGPANFVISGDGVFQGLTETGKTNIGKTKSKLILPSTVKSVAPGGADKEIVSGNTLFDTFAAYIEEIEFEAPQNLVSIGECAFANLTALTTINLGGASGLSNIGKGAFRGCSSLTSLSIASTQIHALPENLARDCERLTDVTLTGVVTSIGNGAFWNCKRLSSFDIPDSVTTIGNNAFNSCISLTEITVPFNVTQIGTQAFYECQKLNTINYYAKSAVSAPNPFGMSASAYSASNITVNIGAYGDSGNYCVEQLPSRLFCDLGTDLIPHGHKGITAVNFVNAKLNGEGEEGWGYNVFRDCTSLTAVTFDERCKISVINLNAFDGCVSLRTITGMEDIGLQKIGDYAFRNCSSLFRIILGAEVNQFGVSAFEGCEKLVEVINLTGQNIRVGKDTPSDAPEDQNKHFGRVSINAKVVYTDKESTSLAYKDYYVFFANGNNVLLLAYMGTGTDLTLPANYESKPYEIYLKAFYKNDTITKITVPEGITTIGNAAFAECSSLTTVKLPSTLDNLGDLAFQNCTALVSVNFAGSPLSVIQTGVFKGCSNLTSITLKGIQTIESEAFLNCTSLVSVKFESHSKRNLETIGSSAFSGCDSLLVVALPESVNKVDKFAFENCTSLNAVYLSGDKKDGATDTIVGYGENVFIGCPNVILISTSPEQYEADKEKDNIEGVYESRLTYIVKLHMIYNDGSLGGEHERNKLYGMDAGYEQTEEKGKWTAGNGLPQQDGYSTSVWYWNDRYESYSDEDFRTYLVTLDNLTAKLNGEGLEGGDKLTDINIYARYIKKPNLELITDRRDPITYDEHTTYSVGEAIQTFFRLDGENIGAGKCDELMALLDFTVSAHYLVNGSYDDAWVSGSQVADAGTYIITIKIGDPHWGQWSSSKTVQFTIEPKTVDISSEIEWDAVGSGLAPNLGSETTLYFYGNTTPYLEPDLDGQKYTSSVVVENSYTVYTGKEVTIVLKQISGQYGTVNENSYKNNKKTDAGTYSATVTITPNNNYKFTYTEQYPRPEDLVKRGLTFRLNASTGELEVAKTWYIVRTNANQLLTWNRDGLYDIKTDADGVAWVYGDKDGYNKIEYPALAVGNSLISELVSFTLIFDDGNEEIVVADEVKLGNQTNFYYYFNESMPAGKYTLIYYIEDTYNDKGDLVSCDDQIFEFIVGASELLNAERAAAVISDYRAEFDSQHSVVFAPTALPTNKQVTPLGIWKEKYGRYFTEYEIVYFVKTGEKKNYLNDSAPTVYYHLSDYTGKTYEGALPGPIGTYTVFYKISAPNYSTVIEELYELNITKTLTLEEFTITNTVEFTGSSVISTVLMLLENKALDGYDVYTLREEDRGNTPTEIFNKYGTSTYTNVGLHRVFILIKDSKSKYIVWDSSISSEHFDTGWYTGAGGRVQGRFLIVTFEISATKNIELTSLSVDKWEYGSFTREKNSPNWVLQFGHDYKKYKFELTSTTNPDETFVFYGDPAKELGVNEVGFDKAPAGKYTLKATSPYDQESGVYEFSKTIEVTIDKATPRFSAVPYIDSWNYGSYSLERVIPSYLFAVKDAEIRGKLKLKYCTAPEYEKDDPRMYDNISSLLVGGQLPIGAYYLVFTLEESDNYNAWTYGVRFQVMSTINFDWVYGDYSKRGAIDSSYFGNPSTVTFEYHALVDGNTRWVTSVEQLIGFNALENELSVGNYEFKASVNGTEVFRTTFHVTKAVNTWQEIPSIKSWEKGGYSVKENSPSATAAFGNDSVAYTITDEDGNVYGINDLRKLGVGKYMLTVTIAGTDNYEELSTVLYFNVTESSVGMTGIMVALIVFSVLALGLAAAGITLYVLRTKKANAQFRKSVKNELRRK